MERRRPEVADVVREYGTRFLRSHGTSPLQRRLLREISSCRTAALGGHKMQCDRCGHEEFAYNSCRNRHCPKCQAMARAEWLEARSRDLLEVPYFHLVFTLPDRLGPLALQNKRRLYGLFFQAVFGALRSIAADPQHLGGEVGGLVVLHTWGQKLQHHTHLHCLVPGVALSPDRSRLLHCRPRFFLPVRVLSRRLRTLLLLSLRKARKAGEIELHGRLRELADPISWDRFMRDLEEKDWVVYAKPPFAGPRTVLKYLARYVHRVAISNQRIVSIKDGQVTFRWKDSAHSAGPRNRTTTLSAEEFLRRFLLHALPSGFVRIRYFGFMAHRVRRRRLEQLRRFLAEDHRPDNAPRPSSDEPASSSVRERSVICPRCRKGTLKIVEVLPAAFPAEAFFDTS